AGGGVLRARRDEARLRACGRGGLPVLFLRRRLPAVPLVWDDFSSNRLPADAFAGALREETACKSFMSFVPFCGLGRVRGLGLALSGLGSLGLKSSVDGIEHSQLGLLDRGDGVVDRDAGLPLKAVRAIRDALSIEILLYPGDVRLLAFMSAAIFARIVFHF